MFTLVVGGAASGKSAYAEDWSASLSSRWVYLATMYPWDAECVTRIQRHRRARAGRGFETVERYTDLAGLTIPEGTSVLLEDLGNLLSNELYAPGGAGADAALRGVEALLTRCEHLTVVTNEVFSGGADYGAETMEYLRALAHLNRVLARRADRLVEVLCGLPNVLKGGAI
ncbi:MAG: bifunctional adenosylcobinamide kinase/adenosylcobinamide-phosphate guanylyltransferase [Oscillospiraceae bacterium]|nr:bifunctional adenosylcobinamide kinase/adenosylcobinamide-phosphate guanylyltransferase [Oscillospiraceae bacterium]